MPQQEPSYWLMKSEPDAYSIDTLKKDGVTLWDGIRNYQARNFMRNMNKGDKDFLPFKLQAPSIVGLMEVLDLKIVITQLIKIQSILIQNQTRKSEMGLCKSKIFV